MRVLMVHNTYRGPGGEDAVARMEADLLRSRGHRVEEYWRSNSEIGGLSGAMGVPFRAVWARDSVAHVAALLDSFKPDIMHVHNTWMVVSPAVYWAAHCRAVPVVQTLHNYRILCANAQFLRNGRPCEMCKTRPFAVPGILHGCYRSSRLQSLLLSGSFATHRLLGTWRQRVDMYIALTQFAMNKFIEGGLPAERVMVKPNFVDPDPGFSQQPGSHALFIGRLSEEKGIRTLLEAWRHLESVPLKVAGDGLLMNEAAVCAEGSPDVELLGWQDGARVISLLHSARFLVFPSVWYEGFPVTIADAFACGVPVIASRLGAMAEIVEDGRTGLHFNPGDARDLAEKVRWAWGHPEAMERMGKEARAEYEAKYTADKNYHALMSIYKMVVE